MLPVLSIKEANGLLRLAVEKKREEYTKLMEAVKARFPAARFPIGCFKTIEEIETKEYPIPALNPNVYLSFSRRVPRDDGKHYSLVTDYYKAPVSYRKKHITYMSDLIDTLIAEGVESDHHLVDFRPPISPCEELAYESLWGSDTVYFEVEGFLVYINPDTYPYRCLGIPAAKSHNTADGQYIETIF